MTTKFIYLNKLKDNWGATTMRLNRIFTENAERKKVLHILTVLNVREHFRVYHREMNENDLGHFSTRVRTGRCWHLMISGEIILSLGGSALTRHQIIKSWHKCGAFIYCSNLKALMVWVLLLPTSLVLSFPRSLPVVICDKFFIVTGDELIVRSQPMAFWRFQCWWRLWISPRWSF